MIALRRSQGDYQASIGNGRGKRLTDEIRKEFDGLIGTEQQLRMARNEKVSSVTVTAISVFVLFIVGLSALLAYLGRRDLLALSAATRKLAGPAACGRAPGAPGLAAQRPDPAGEQVLGQLTLPMLGDNILRFCRLPGQRGGRCMCVTSMAAWCAWPPTAWMPKSRLGSR
jgi:hypothetical protein